MIPVKCINRAISDIQISQQAAASPMPGQQASSWFNPRQNNGRSRENPAGTGIFGRIPVHRDPLRGDVDSGRTYSRISSARSIIRPAVLSIAARGSCARRFPKSRPVRSSIVATGTW